MPEKDDLDLLLDSALSTYADPGPDSGLEQRVLTALAGAAGEGRIPNTKTRRWLVWAIAVPVAASLLLWLSFAKFNLAPPAQNQQAHQSTPSAYHATDSPAVPLGGLKSHGLGRAGNRHQSSRPSKTTVANQPPIPRLDVFPAPRPLSSQEQALVTTATRSSESQREAMVAIEKKLDTPLSIAALDIPPLVAPDEGKK